MNAIQTTIAGVFVALFARSSKISQAERIDRAFERATISSGAYGNGYIEGYGSGYDAGYEAGLRVGALAEKQTLTAVLRILESQPENAADNIKQLLAFSSAA
ncbi:hypothetical protein CLV58_101209 [Spirosoma oryzae]|uniref:Uncharacterized protein n=1 Tax=Spirosoma oryzae TaxID=1469603 RepID=A0A2T0TNB7_9BACT|nr:hypothetical protein [Spirosoma oryzae]PRY47143.1 hypothetical protein CLV58_101209 [Spirosoma oryzae]